MTEITQPRDTRLAVLRGIRNRCPNCGQGKVMEGYLTLVPTCPNCGEPLGRHRAADAPAFFTITLVMAIATPLIGLVWILYRPDPLVLALLLTSFITILTLILLRLVKGGIIGYLWAHDERDAGSWT